MKTKGIFKSAILSLTALFLYTLNLNAELVLHWPFEEGSGANTADLSGNGHGGVLTNMDPATDWIGSGLAPVPSGTAYALDFDGNDDWVAASVDGYTGVTGSLARSVSAWIKTTADDPPIISWGENVGGKKFVFRVQDDNGTNGAIRVEVNGGFIVGALPVDDGTWHHVAAVIPTHTSLNVTDVRLYVDGEIQGTSDSQAKDMFTSSAREVRVGTRFTGERYAGQIDEVRVYDHTLTPSELNALAGVVDPYADAVLADAPEGWWRFGENIGARIANEGSTMAYIDASSANGAITDRYLPGLISSTPNRSIRFDGYDDRITIPSHSSINLDSFTQKTLESWFMPLAYSTNDLRRIIYEQGGSTRGFNHYIQRDGDDYYFRCGAWSSTPKLFPQRVPVETGEVYHAVSVYDGSKKRLVGYLNGACVNSGVNSSLGDVTTHTDGVSIGCFNGTTMLDNGSASNNGTNSIAAVIDDVATYNNNLTFERIQEHYIAGSGDNLGLRDGVTRGVLVNYDADNDTDGDSVFEDSIGSLDTTATANMYDWSLSGVDRVQVSDRLAAVTNAYRFDGSDTALTRSFQYIAGHSYVFSACVEMVFNPADYNGDEVLFETGGATTGMSLALNDSILRLFVRYQTSNEIDVQFDLNELSSWQRKGFIHAVGVMDIDNTNAYIYVNGELKAQATGSGDVDEWSGTNDAGMGCVNNQVASPVSLSMFEGDIAIMRLYPTVLTEEQIQANYLALEPPEILPATILLLR